MKKPKHNQPLLFGAAPEAVPTNNAPRTGLESGLIRRVMLGWRRCAPELVAEHLLSIANEGLCGVPDLRGYVVVVPGGRFGRTLVSMLAGSAGAPGRAAGVIPPTIITPGELAATLGVRSAAGAVADETTKRLAWLTALKETPASIMQNLAVRIPSAFLEWNHLATMMMSLSNSLAGELMSIRKAAASLGEHHEQARRWEAAGLIQERYLGILADHGRVDAALDAVLHGRESAAETSPWLGVVLACVPELNAAAREAVRGFARALKPSGRCTALIHAPDEHAERFDGFGCIAHDRWAEYAIDVTHVSIMHTDGLSEQASLAVDLAERILERADGGSVFTDVCIGVPDERLRPMLERAASSCPDLRLRWAGGRRLSHAPVFDLLARIQAWAEAPGFSTCAAILRHVDVHTGIALQLHGQSAVVGETLLNWLDGVAAHHVPRGDPFSTLDSAAAERHVVAREAQRLISLLSDRSLRPEQRLAEFLVSIYGGRGADDEDSLNVAAVRSVSEVLEQLHALGELTTRALGSDLAPTLTVLAGVLCEEAEPHEFDPAAVEMVGWLEAVHDPSAHLLLTGVHEGSLPGKPAPLPLLDDRTRQHLGLAPPSGRLARDAFLLAGLASRALAGDVSVVALCARRDESGEALLPSRLLLNGPPDEVAGRILSWARPPKHERARVHALTSADSSEWSPLPMSHGSPPAAMRVTWFGEYLRSPYQFYLQRILGLKEIPESIPELNAAAFGSTLHAVLASWAGTDAVDSTHPPTLRTALLDLLSTEYARFGEPLRTTVALQRGSMERRLARFASWQSKRRADGWRIVHAEWSPDDADCGKDFGTVVLDMADQAAMPLIGRIDRIEVHEDSGRLAVSDYKTGHDVTEPGSFHRRRNGQWVNLQLPLYRRLVMPLAPDKPIELCFITLSASPMDDRCLRCAEWRDADLASADEAARTVVRAVRAGQFRIPGRPLPTGPALSVLCGEGLLIASTFAGARDDAAGDSEP